MNMNPIAMTNTIPGPPGQAFFGHLRAFKNSPLDLFLSSTRRYGDAVQFQILNRKVFLFNHPSAVKHILLDNHKNYSKKTIVVKKLMVLGSGLIFSDGEEWKRQRKMLQPSFRKRCLRNFFNIMVQETRETLDHWQRQRLQRVNLSHEITQLTLRVVCRALFGSNISVAEGLGASVAYLLHAARARTLNIINLPLSVPSPGNLKFRHHRKILSDHIQALIKKRKIDGPGEDMLSMLLYQEHDNISEEELLNQVQTFLLAGHDTTASAIQWTLQLLSTSKTHYELCREEAAHVAEISQENLQNLKQIGNALQEALRLYPPAWIIPRFSLAEDEVMGFTLPEQTGVYLSPYSLHRHPAFWQEPDRFNPSRFEGELPHPFCYIPFGAGPRVCIGREFALQEAMVIITLLLKHYNIQVDPLNYRAKAGITLRPDPEMTAAIQLIKSKSETKGPMALA